MKSKLLKKSISILMIFAILINLIPNFGLLKVVSYASESSAGSGLVVKPGLTEFEIDSNMGNKIYKLDVYLRNITTAIWYLKLSYNPEKMVPGVITKNNRTGLIVSSDKATKADDAIVFTDENELFQLSTNKNRELNNSEGYIYFGGIKPFKPRN